MLKYLAVGSLVLAVLLGLQSYRVERLRADIRVIAQERDDAVDDLTEYKIQADKDAQTQAVVCNTRVSEARRSAIAIGKLYDRPIHVDAEGCARRSIINERELRQTLQPDAPSS